MAPLHRLCLCLVVLSGIAFQAAPGQAEEILPHIEADVSFNPETRVLEATVVLRAAPALAQSFRLAPWLTVETAAMAGEPVAAQAVGGGRQLQLPKNPEAHPVTMTLKGTVPPLPPAEARRSTRGAMADAREGSYLPGYAAWLPDLGVDWITYRLAVRVPPGQVAVATGQLVEDVDGHTVFDADTPAELPSLFVGPYQVSERKAGTLRIRTYFHADIADHADHYLEAAEGYIRRFEEEIGAYPYADFHIISAPLPVGLGFPNLTYIGRTIVGLPFMRGRSLAHEVAHNWWGNGVAVDYRAGNWAEGLTTYMADYGLARDQGPQAAREMRLGWLRDFAALPVTERSPVRAFVSKTHDRAQIIGYNKAAHLFHMLRQELGDAAFDDGIKRFWDGNKFTVAGWTDLQAAFEAASGRNLESFFDQWLTRPGAPRIELSDIRVERTGDRHELSYTLTQTAPVYALDVPVVIETAAGIERDVVRLTGETTALSRMVSSQPLTLSIDPDFDLFRELLDGESPPILRDVTLAPAAELLVLNEDSGFRDAATGLARTLSRTVTPLDTDGATPPATKPRLVMGHGDEIAAYVTEIFGDEGLPEPVRAGTAAAWVVEGPAGLPHLLVRADDAAALAALIRPLRHYRSRAYVVFEGRRAIDRGVWQATVSPLTRDLTSR